jgi:hypothetical protein
MRPKEIPIKKSVQLVAPVVVALNLAQMIRLLNIN